MMITKRIFAMGLITGMLTLASMTKAQAQSAYESALEKIDAKHQDCLDLGENMIACSGDYYAAMDSMLNVVYKDALKGLNTEEKTTLRTEQREWLAKRNIKFKEIEAEVKETGNGSITRMENLEDKAGYIRERVDELIAALK
jgi:uncharacterized protein YecT (DUF1311 family)